MSRHIRDGIQETLDADGSGWCVSHYAAAVGLSRIIDGEMQTAFWLYAPTDQAEYITDGLLSAAEEMQHCVIEEESE
jgi:hypothetical protein